jgi:type IV secretory pathway VirB4 component
VSLHPIDKSLASVLPYGHFIGDGEIYLRGKGLLVGCELHGLSLETDSDQNTRAAAQRLARAMSHFGTGDMLQCIFYRLPATRYPARQFPSRAARMVDDERRQRFEAGEYWRTIPRLYVTHQFESALQNRAKAAFFSAERSTQANIELHRERFHQRLTGFRDAAGLNLVPLNTAQVFRDLILSITGRDYPAVPPSGKVRLNEVVSSERWYGGVAPWVGDLHMRPVCVTAYPAETIPQMLAVLLRHPGQMTLCARFICQDPHDTQEQLQLERTFWVRAQLGSLMDIIAKVLNIPRRKTLNQDIEAQIAEVDEATAAASAGMPFGWCTITVVIIDPNPEMASLRARDLVKDLAALGITARIEDANAAEAIMGTWPGDGWSNVRRPMITAGNFAELVLPVEHWPGTPFIDSPFFEDETPVPLVCSGSGREPFYPPSHLGAVANQLVIGPTGTGKSALLGVLAAAITGLRNARIVWLDLDYSSFVLAHAMSAGYQELAADGSSPLCPLVHLDDPGGIGWLFDWFMRLFARWQIQLDEQQAADLTEALELARSQGLRTMTLFTNLIQQPRLREVLSNYITCGKWGHIFDGEAVSAGINGGGAVTLFEMRGLVALGERAAAPATELILHSVETVMTGDPVFIICDEAWRLLSDPVSSDWLFEAIRTFRKKNAGITLATQSMTEVANSPYRDLLLESCPGKIFLPNPDARGEYVRNAYLKLGLSERETEIISDAQPRRQYYFHSSQGRRLFTLDLGSIALALCAATGYRDVAQARELLKQHGAAKFLDAWLHARGLGPAPEAPAGSTTRLTEITYTNGRAHNAD